MGLALLSTTEALTRRAGAGALGEMGGLGRLLGEVRGGFAVVSVGMRVVLVTALGQKQPVVAPVLSRHCPKSPPSTSKVFGHAP